jgi:hypothetical protein
VVTDDDDFSSNISLKAFVYPDIYTKTHKHGWH